MVRIHHDLKRRQRRKHQAFGKPASSNPVQVHVHENPEEFFRILDAGIADGSVISIGRVEDVPS